MCREIRVDASLGAGCRSFVYSAARDTLPNLFLERLESRLDDERLFRSALQSRFSVGISEHPPAAERELAAAVRLSPDYATARQWYGTLLGRLKKCDAAVEQVRISSEIDLVTPIINEAVGSTFSVCGEPERAAAAHRRVLEMHPAATLFAQHRADAHALAAGVVRDAH